MSWTTEQIQSSRCCSALSGTPLSFFPLLLRKRGTYGGSANCILLLSQEDAPLPESHGRSPGHPGWGAALIGFPRPLTRFRWMAFDQNVPFANILLWPAWAPTSPPPKGKPGTPTPLSTHLGTPKPRQATTFLHSIITSCLNHKLSYNAFAHQMSWQGTPCPCHKLIP